MKARSAKAKGNRLEQAIAKAYRYYKIDETAKRMPTSGAMAHFKSDIFKQFDYQWRDECKNQERVQFWSWWEQASNQASVGEHPVLHISANHRPIVTCLRMEDYMTLRS